MDGFPRRTLAVWLDQCHHQCICSTSSSRPIPPLFRFHLVIQNCTFPRDLSFSPCRATDIYRFKNVIVRWFCFKSVSLFSVIAMFSQKFNWKSLERSLRFYWAMVENKLWLCWPAYLPILWSGDKMGHQCLYAEVYYPGSLNTREVSGAAWQSGFPGFKPTLEIEYQLFWANFTYQISLVLSQHCRLSISSFGLILHTRFPWF